MDPSRGYPNDNPGKEQNDNPYHKNYMGVTAPKKNEKTITPGGKEMDGVQGPKKNEKR